MFWSPFVYKLKVCLGTVLFFLLNGKSAFFANGKENNQEYGRSDNEENQKQGNDEDGNESEAQGIGFDGRGNIGEPDAGSEMGKGFFIYVWEK